MTTLKKPPPNRTVALLTPLVFAPLAGAISVAAAEYAPGMEIDEGSLTAIFIAGATIAFGKAAQWTKGWQAQEQREADHAPATLELDDGDEDLPALIADDLDDDTEAVVEAFRLDDETDSDNPFFDDDGFDVDLGEDEDEDQELMALTPAREE